MKLYTMKCIKDLERMEECFEPDNQEERCFIKLETKAEWRVYENFTSYGTDREALNSMIRSCDGDAMGDDDVYFYIQPLDGDVEVGNTFEDADGLVWERVK